MRYPRSGMRVWGTAVLFVTVACDPVAQAIVATPDAESGDDAADDWMPDPEDDADADGVPRSEDCNDFHAAIHPDAPEVFDGFDNDCDGAIDEDGANDPAFEGYGNAVVGGAGGEVVRVTSLEDGGPGSLREALVNGTGPTIIEFDVAGEITLESRLSVERPFVTINGASAPAPGITLRLGGGEASLVVQGTHDVIITHLRIVGPHVIGQEPPDNTAGLAIDGETNPDNVASGVVFDHLTVLGTNGGGPDLWGEMRDVTVSYCLIADSHSGTSVSYFGGDSFYTLQRISLHHNAWIGNENHNPQLRADVRDFDFVNNVIADWSDDGIGLWIRAKEGEPTVDANIVANHFSSGTRTQWSIVFAEQPGPDGDGGPMAPAAQGDVVTSAALGSLWIADNELPSETIDKFSTTAQALPVPAAAVVQRFDAATLAEATLAVAGAHHRTAVEQSRIDGVASRF